MIRIVFPPIGTKIFIFYLLINVNALCYTLPSNLVNHLIDIEGAKNKDYSLKVCLYMLATTNDLLFVTTN